MADKVKFRTSYSKEHKAQAKVEGKGLATLNLHFPNGTVNETQGCFEASELRFLMWAMALASNKHSRPLPDLEELVRKHFGDALPPIVTPEVFVRRGVDEPNLGVTPS